MAPSESEREIRLAALLVAVESQLRDGKPIDMASVQARYPDLANELPALLEMARDLDTAAENWKSGCTLDESETRTTTHPPANNPAAAPVPLPEMIGRYRILSRLGAGGMGTVYKAEDTQLHRAVAVKVPRFNPSLPDKSIAVQRFLREARAAAQVCHPHICPIHDVGEQDGTPYAVMAYVAGTSLAELMERERLDPTRAAELVRKVALGLEAVHEKGIIHRDLKPGNILLDRAGEPQLTDFGLARPEKDADYLAQLTHEGAVVGTPAYMAPEQARADPERLGPWTDVYSLGVVFYQLLTSCLPFEGPMMVILFKIAHEPVPPPSSLQPDLDGAIEAIVLKAMARRPEDRYQSAREFAGALEAWSACQKTATPALLPSAVSLEKVPEDASPPMTAAKRRRWTLVAAVAAAVLLLAGGSLIAPQIIIRLKGPDGDTEIKVPRERDVEIEKDGKVIAKIPGDGKKAKGDLLATGAEHTDGVTHLALSRDGIKVLTYSSDKVLWFWELDAEKGKFTPAWKQRVERVQSLALHPTGSQALLAIGGNSNLSQVNTQTEEMKDRRLGRFFGAGGVVFSADGRRFLVAEHHGGFSICDWQDGDVLRKFMDWTSGPRVRPALQLCFSGDGERILSSGDDNTVRLWNSTNADELKKLPPFSSARKRVIALSPDAKQALISQDNGLQVWDLNAGKSVGELKGHKDHVTAVTFGPNGKWAVSASRDKTLRVWDVAAGKELGRLEGHEDDVTCVAVISQGRRIISGSRDKTLRVWRWTE